MGIHAIGVLGGASAVPAPLTAATSGDDEVKRTANESLDVLRGNDVDEMMLSAIAGSDTDTRSVLIRSLATRGAKSALPMLFKATEDSDESIRAKAFDALGTLAGPDELPQLIALVEKMNGNSAQPQAESALVAVSQKAADANARAKAVLDAFSASKDEKFAHRLPRSQAESATPARCQHCCATSQRKRTNLLCRKLRSAR